MANGLTGVPYSSLCFSAFPERGEGPLGPSLSCVVAFVGLFSSGSVLIGLYAAYLAVHYVKSDYGKIVTEDKPLQNLKLEISESDAVVWKTGRWADIALPNMFVVLWLALLFLSIHLSRRWTYASEAMFILGGGIGVALCLVALCVYKEKRRRGRTLTVAPGPGEATQSDVEPAREEESREVENAQFKNRV